MSFIIQQLILVFPLHFDYLVKQNFDFEYFRNVFIKLTINFAFIITIIITTIVIVII